MTALAMASPSDPIVVAAEEELVRLDAQIEVAQLELDKLKARGKAIRVFVKALGPKSPRKKRGTGTVVALGISDDRRTEFVSFLTGNTDEFSAVDVAKALKWSDSYTSKALTTMRSEGMIRLAGTIGRGKRVYRSML